MNKKLFLGMIATTGLLFATSCSSEDLIETTSGENVNVSFTVNTDSSVGSRAVADGMTAKKLYFAVFDSITGLEHQCGNLNMENGEANVKLTLAKNNTYSIAFWAQAEDAPYTFDDLTGKVTINYEGANNAENRDAFYANRKYTVKGDINETVTLYRPFAQINVGTTIDDYNNVFPTYDYVKSSVILNGEFGTEFNVLTGEVTATTSTPINYQVADAPTAADNNLRVANKDYEYISTCYVLPASSTESQTVKAEFKFDLSPMMSVELSQGLDMLPIQSNYRTNIVGDILTANAEWNVVIDNEFDGEYNNIAESNEPAVSADGTTYYVSTPAQWNWMVANNGQIKQVNKNVTLMADLDFNGTEVAPLYPVVADFVLDGNGKTIKNAKYIFGSLSPYKKGLITLEGYASNSNLTVKNLTLDHITASSNSSNDEEHGYSSALISDVQNKANVTIDGVNVYSSEICGIQSIGALVGFIPAGSTVTIKNSTVKGNNLYNSKIENESGYVCGLVGKVAGTLNVESTVNVDNNYISAYYALNRGPKSIDAVAAVRNNGVINSEANVVNNNRIYKNPIVEADLKISTKEELIDFANNYSNYNNKTVALVNDIDLTGVDWNPIGGPGGICPRAPFYGTFEGCGLTISNLTVTEKDGVDVHEANGFFGWLNGTIKNLNFENAIIKGHHDVAVVVGYLSAGLVENCNVNNATVEATYLNEERDGDKAAVLVGYINNGVVKNCTIKNSTVAAVRDAGQGVGACTEAISENFSGNSVENVTVTGEGDNIREEFVGRIVE